jgi:hypothetical protein
MITLLTSGQRGQTVHLMNLNDMQMLQDRCRFHIIEHTKTSKPGLSAPTIVIKQYPANEKICPLSTLRDYLARTNPLRCGENKLFISFQRPYKAVTRQQYSSDLWPLKIKRNCIVDKSLAVRLSLYLYCLINGAIRIKIPPFDSA